jgi:ribosome-binding ATPase YchF (GTP1/OBG family)
VVDDGDPDGNVLPAVGRLADMLSVALAGKPNAGKSTFYKAATMADVDVGNYPFTTIDPNRGVTHARTRCPCLDREERCGNCEDGIRYVPVELLDVAGLVPGAHEGRGLGNQFLDALTDADAILSVVDAAGETNEEGEPVEVGAYDPVEEADFVEDELEQWLAGIVADNWETVVRKSRSPDFDIDDALTEMLTGFGATVYDVAASLRAVEYPEDPQQWTDDDRERLARDVRERTKPIVLVANKADIAPDGNVDRLRDETGAPVTATTADGELALRTAAEAGVIAYHPGDEDFDVVGEISDAQRDGLETIREVMAENGGTGVQAAINTAVYDTLDMITVYPVENETRWTDGSGAVLPDAFLLPRGSTPNDLAYAVHSDIGDGYLHAVDARSDRRIGEDHELEEGDVIKVVSTAN